MARQGSSRRRCIITATISSISSGALRKMPSSGSCGTAVFVDVGSW
jgi:hypothetical protein